LVSLFNYLDRMVIAVMIEPMLLLWERVYFAIAAMYARYDLVGARAESVSVE
jgi:hypothetical protein